MAHNHGSPSDNSPTASSSDMMMIPYLHFTGGDALYFHNWTPKSAGAIAGACIGLALIAILERYVAALRGTLDSHWRTRALAIASARDQSISESTEKPCQNSGNKSGSISDGIQELSRDTSSSSTDSNKPRTVTIRRRLRTIPPFIAAHDIPRGVLYGLQMLLMYTLMLAVMTFQAAYFISIVLGLGIGETIFGRIARDSH